ncbi:hypothetical protein J437_LFUL007368 [Ladona fulva]|uniref:Uncharacterized protein n=1 Tax=Ladona fulva TaxID=123851 RepID=A0A8K0K1B0_LADFU|nr:hypothetical protein J437_LFUL007368 [Ladona fulva]
MLTEKMIVPRGLASGFPILVSSGLDPLSFLVGIVFLIFILLVPRLSHGPFFAPAGIGAAPVSSGAVYTKKRSSREIRRDMTVNKQISGIEFDFLTQNVFQAIQNHVKYYSEESS